ncbi:MAG: CHAT domain-containing protein [Chitinophagaceae bacterium]|nr:CHAT domain-containing protein [Chitinophagaceae bacterium]
MKGSLTIILLSISLHSFSQTWQELNDSLIQYYNNGEYKKGVVAGEKALSDAKKEFGENHRDYATILSNIALGYASMGQYKKAEPLYIRVIEIRKNVLGETDPDYAVSLNELAELYKNTGQYEKVVPLYIMAIEVNKKVLGETDPDYAISLGKLAELYLSLGQYEKAGPLYIQSMDIFKKTSGENNTDYATSINNMARFYESTGQYKNAEPLYISAMSIYRKVLVDDDLFYATTLNNLAGLYNKIGQYEKAEPLYIESMAIMKKVLGETHADYASSLNNLAELYRAMGQYQSAEPLYIAAMSIWKKTWGKTHPVYAGGLNNLAVLYAGMGLYEKAEPLYIESMAIMKKALGESHPDYASSLNNLAGLYENMGQYEKAEPFYTQALIIRKKTLGESHPDYAIGLSNLGFLYQSMGQYEKAETFILQNNGIALQNLLNNFTIFSEKEKGNYITNKIGLLAMNNSFIYNYKKTSSLFLRNNFNQQLIFKSLALADTRNVLASAQQSNDTTIRRVLKEWLNAKKILAIQYSLPIAKRSTDLKIIERNTENLEKELTRRSSGFRNQQTALKTSMQDVQKNLQEDEVAVEFVQFRLYNKKWTDSILYGAYILNKNDSVPVFVPLCEEKQLQYLFDSAGNTATSMVSSFYRGLDIKNKSSVSLGKELYKLVWEPLEPYLKGIKKVSYSPAGKLYSIAFQALPIDSTTVLMDRYQLQQYISTRQIALRDSENQTSKPRNITLFGNASFTMDSLQLIKQKVNQPEKEIVSTSIYAPQKRSSDNNTWNNLPGTAEEVSKIKLLFDQNKITTKSFIQTSASEENLKALDANSPQILHIATHGFFLPEPDKKRKDNSLNNENSYTLADDPLLRSGLIFAGGNYAWSGKTPIDGVEDGIATAYEISQLNLSNTELVVLSACETALGDVKGSEGVFGLQRAFKMAGVKKMIVSLWQVPDKETAELMTTFYAYWMKGKTINDSLTQAQADMRKKHSPFYWAAFVLVE